MAAPSYSLHLIASGQIAGGLSPVINHGEDRSTGHVEDDGVSRYRLCDRRSPTER